jgi:ribosomal protein S19E (S16A)
MVTSALQQAFTAAGRGSSIASATHRLRREGLIESTHEGYVLSRKAKDRLRHRKGA